MRKRERQIGDDRIGKGEEVEKRIGRKGRERRVALKDEGRGKTGGEDRMGKFDSM